MVPPSGFRFRLFCSCVLSLLLISASGLDIGSGRLDQQFHSPRCCTGLDCLAKAGSSPPRTAFVTSVRDSAYLMLLRELHCSLQKSNPGVPLVILGCEGDLTPGEADQVRQMGEYLLVPDVNITSLHTARFSRNWMKLQAWGLVMYDALILLDADMVVQGDLSHLFSLPTDFAWTFANAPDENGRIYDWNLAGVILLRPCAAVEKHMLQLALSHEELQFRFQFAEQTFMMWYYRYTAWWLPMTYNAWSRGLVDGLTGSGEQPLAVHFADEDKPFNSSPASTEWRYLCHQPRVYHQQQQEQEQQQQQPPKHHHRRQQSDLRT